MNSVKINDQIFKQIKEKPVLGPFLVNFSNFEDKKAFPEKSGSVTHNFIWVSSTIPNFRKD